MNTKQDVADTAKTAVKPTAKAKGNASTVDDAAKKNTPQTQETETVPVFTSRRVWPD